MKKYPLKKIIPFAIAGIILVVGIVLSQGKKEVTLSANSPLVGQKAVVYKSPTCGCCNLYIDYLRDRGMNVEEVSTSDMESIKKQYSIPQGKESCHTTLIGDYVVEGHVPIEVIEKLVSEKPALRGITLPDMPSGSPGMPGAKYGLFQIYGFAEDGNTSMYMEY